MEVFVKFIQKDRGECQKILVVLCQFYQNSVNIFKNGVVENRKDIKASK